MDALSVPPDLLLRRLGHVAVAAVAAQVLLVLAVGHCASAQFMQLVAAVLEALLI